MAVIFRVVCRILLAVAVLMLLAGGLDQYLRIAGRAPLIGYLKYLRASNPVCSMEDGRNGIESNYRTARASQTLMRSSKLVRGDGSLEFWETPLWNFWVPRGTRASHVHFAMAQWIEPAYSGSPITKGAHILDGGGFVGDFAKFAFRQGAAKVFIAEPSARAIECIRRNLEVELASGAAILYPKGLWDKEDTLLLEHPLENNPAANSVVKSGGDARNGEWVPLATIDRMVEELGIQRLDVLKLDIEGAETKAVLGARKTIARFRPVVTIATEHTDDRIQNNRNVIAAMKAVAPDYTPRCGYCAFLQETVVPETLYFYPPGK